MTQLCVNNIPTKFQLYILFRFWENEGGGAESAPPPDLRSPKKPSPNRVKSWLKRFDKNRKVPGSLGPRPGLGIQPRYKVPGDLRVK